MFEPDDPHVDANQEHIWTSFVDLLSGLVAVLLLTLLMPNLVASAKEAQRRKETQTNDAARNAAGLPTAEFKPIAFDQAGHALTLGEGAFEKDSYRLTPPIARVLRRCQPAIETYLAAAQENQIAVEGHSDALDFRPGATIRSPAGAIDSNYALSALRAVAAREFLLSTFGTTGTGTRKFESKVAVAGYGADRPRKGTDGPMDPRNRRVEIRFSGKDVASFDRVTSELEAALRVP